MKKAFLVVTVTLLAMATLATPVLAIGPQNAESNPNRISAEAATGATVTELWLPSGVMNEWINAPFGPPGRAQVLDASKVNIGNAIVPGPYDDPYAFFDNENQWYYMTEENFVFLLTFMGLEAHHAYPEGLYIRIIYVAYK